MHQVSRQRIEPWLKYSNLTIIKLAAVRRLGFLGITNLTADTVLRANMCHSAIFHADRSNRCRGMVVL